MAEQTPVTRRGMLASAIGGAAAVAASQLVRPSAALATDGNLHLNSANTASARTDLTAGLDADAVLLVANDGAGDAVVGAGGTGVYGTGGYGVMGDVDVGGTGVYGFIGSGAAPVAPASVGVYAAAGSTSHTALQVNGKVKFSRAGRLTVAAGAGYVGKTLTGVTTSSLIIATLQTNRSGYYIRAAVPASGSFRVYLNKTADVNIAVAYFVIN